MSSTAGTRVWPRSWRSSRPTCGALWPRQECHRLVAPLQKPGPRLDEELGMDPVILSASAAVQEILATYRARNLPIEKFREMSLTEIHDPLKAFSEACRYELQLLQQDGT